MLKKLIHVWYISQVYLQIFWTWLKFDKIKEELCHPQSQKIIKPNLTDSNFLKLYIP